MDYSTTPGNVKIYWINFIGYVKTLRRFSLFARKYINKPICKDGHVEHTREQSYRNGLSAKINVITRENILRTLLSGQTMTEIGSG